MQRELPVRAIEFPSVDEPLRDDVHRLGKLVGEVLAEQHGAEFLKQVEQLRVAAIKRREKNHSPSKLSALLSAHSPHEAERLARAFATYFQVVNVAERVHRIRRRREYQIEVGGDQPGGLHEALTLAQQLGFTLESLAQVLAELEIEPVFTAHPTEAVRQSLLSKESEIVRCLLAEISGRRTPGESATDWSRMRTALTAGWQTATLAPVKPGVADERDHAMHYLLEPVYRMLPVFFEVLLDGLARKFGAPETEALAELPMLLRFGTWVGGDMDGNPNVGAETIAATLAYQRKQILDRYHKELMELGQLLSQSDTLIGVSETLKLQLKHYLEMFPEVAGQISQRYRDMPYRNFFRLLRARIEATREEREHAYRSSEELVLDLRMVIESLEQNKGRHAGGFAVRRLLWRVRTFGFHLARLDVRQGAQVHKKVLFAMDPELATHASPSERIAELASGRAHASAQLSDPQLDRVRAVFQCMDQLRARYGSGCFGLYIISMTQNATDVLGVLALARAGGLLESGAVPLDVAPLFETIEDLRSAPQTLRSMLSDGCYRTHLSARGDRQFVMLGYSDSAKDGGLLAARMALLQAQSELLEVADEHGIRLDFFHGRGGSVSRGGGKATAAIMAAPIATMNGRLRVTEQGEVIHRKFGIDALALRSLAQTSAAVLSARLAPPSPDQRETLWHAQLSTLAEVSLHAYRELVGDNEDFVRYFRAATPIDVIERMTLGSRPARRGGAQIRDLRAIPWVFAWTQSRCMLPGWFGLGSALEYGVKRYGIDEMRAMAQEWRFLASLLTDVEMVMAKTDMAIAACYSELAGDLHARYFPLLEAEHKRTLHYLVEVNERALLENDPRLKRSLRLRNPYVDPINCLQIDLLKRWRAEGCKNDELQRALITSVQGVSQALQNTG